MKNACSMCKVIEQIKKGENPWFVKEMESGYVILGWNQHFYGYSLFICKQHVTELFELDKEFLSKFTYEMSIVAKAIKKCFNAEKINYECLGNGDIHLHWHIFPRKKGDLLNYGDNGKGPVWWLPKEIMWSESNKPSPSELETMKNKLLRAINDEIASN
ncbi:MAG: HIT family protein [Clostridia bacterium]|nr:HIT family protein [Clostridia bacterium]